MISTGRLQQGYCFCNDISEPSQSVKSVSTCDSLIRSVSIGLLATYQASSGSLRRPLVRMNKIPKPLSKPTRAYARAPFAGIAQASWMAVRLGGVGVLDMGAYYAPRLRKLESMSIERSRSSRSLSHCQPGTLSQIADESKTAGR